MFRVQRACALNPETVSPLNANQVIAQIPDVQGQCLQRLLSRLELVHQIAQECVSGNAAISLLVQELIHGLRPPRFQLSKLDICRLEGLVGTAQDRTCVMDLFHCYSD